MQKQIYVPPTDTSRSARKKQLRGVLKSKTLQRFVCEISLTACPRTITGFAVIPSLEKAMETYEMLARIQKEVPAYAFTPILSR